MIVLVSRYAVRFVSEGNHFILISETTNNQNKEKSPKYKSKLFLMLMLNDKDVIMISSMTLIGDYYAP